MKLKDGIVYNDETEYEYIKLSEQAILGIIMIVQKVFLNMAQEKEEKSIEEYLDESEFVLQDGELVLTNPVTLSVDTEFLNGDEEDEEELEDEEEPSFESTINYKN